MLTGDLQVDVVCAAVTFPLTTACHAVRAAAVAQTEQEPRFNVEQKQRRCDVGQASDRSVICATAFLID